MSSFDSPDITVGGLNEVENITFQLAIALEFLANELKDSTLFSHINLNTEFDFPFEEKELFFNVINAQVINIIPFVLKHLHNSEYSQDPIFLTDEIRLILDSPEIIDNFPLKIEDFFYLESTGNIVFSLRFKGKIYKQLRFDAEGKWVSTSSIFYNREHIFEYIREGEKGIIFRVVDNNDIYLFSEVARESFDKLEVRRDSVGYSSYLIKQILTDNSDYPICTEEISDLSYPTSRKIIAYNDFNSPQSKQLNQKVLTTEIYYNDSNSGFIAETDIQTFNIDPKNDLSTSTLSRFIRFYNDMFEESAGDLVRNMLKHALVYRSVTEANLLTNFPTNIKLHLNYRSRIDIVIENDANGLPFSLTFMDKWYRVLAVSTTPDGRMTFYVDKQGKRSISFTIVNGFPEKISIRNMY